MHDVPERGQAPYAGGHRIPRRLCSVEGCTNRHYGHGFCETHYQRFRKSGSPLVLVHSRERRHVRLSDEKVAEAKKMREAGHSQEAVAKVFGVHRTAISAMERGVTWRKSSAV